MGETNIVAALYREVAGLIVTIVVAGVTAIVVLGIYAMDYEKLPEDVVDPEEPWPDGPLGEEYE